MDEHAARWRSKHMRCTICLWRGTWAEAEDSPKVKPKAIEPHEQAIQDAYEEKEQQVTKVGQPHSPPCPECGHHLLFIIKRSLKGHLPPHPTLPRSDPSAGAETRAH